MAQVVLDRAVGSDVFDQRHVHDAVDPGRPSRNPATSSGNSRRMLDTTSCSSVPRKQRLASVTMRRRVAELAENLVVASPLQIVARSAVIANEPCLHGGH